MSGMFLYDVLRIHGLLPGSPAWDDLAKSEQQTYQGVARYLGVRDEDSPGNIPVGQTIRVKYPQEYDPTPPARMQANFFRAALKKYGRHLPTCSTGAPCSCGFEEIEKQL